MSLATLAGQSVDITVHATINGTRGERGGGVSAGLDVNDILHVVKGR